MFSAVLVAIGGRQVGWKALEQGLLVAEKGPAQVHLALTKLVEMCHLSEHPLALQLGIGAARAPLSVVKGLNIASAEQSRHTHP